MKRRSRLLVTAILTGLSSLAGAGTERTAASLEKKLIEYGWDVPFPDFVRDHVRDMEKRPFDGLIFKLRGGGKVMTPVRWDEAKFAGDYEILKQIQWQKFTDNFVIMWAASDQDWFDDRHWQAIEHNVKLVARAARVGRCVGVCFDQEPYGTNPWAYNRVAHRDTKSFAEYEAVVRQRGSQFIRALESELPGAAVLTLFQLSYFSPLLVTMDPAQRASRLSEMHYALLPAFLNGMLAAAGPDARIVDGNEAAYYYTDSRSHVEVYHRMKQRGLLLVDPQLWGKYRHQVQAGQALYVDQYFGLRSRKVLGHYMTAEERPKWFEHNVYWSLNTTDRYVWCYSEKMNWWKNKGIPPGCEEAIRAAREKLAAGAALGLDLEPIVKVARERERAEIASRLKLRTADIRRRPANTVPPVVDGRLDDAVWQSTRPLQTFVPLAARPRELQAAAQAWVTYDDTFLHVAVRCEEPAPKRMHIVGKQQDDPLWEGDDVEVLIAPPGKTLPFFHFMLNPKGVHWDAVHHAGPAADLTFNPQWQHAAIMEPQAWTAEISIPWASLKMQVPRSGTKLRANICRQRGKGTELSAWSPMANGFLEHDLFGTWVFR